MVKDFEGSLDGNYPLLWYGYFFNRTHGVLFRVLTDDHSFQTLALVSFQTLQISNFSSLNSGRVLRGLEAASDLYPSHILRLVNRWPMFSLLY